MKTVKLTNGFEVKVEPDELNDMYFVEALAEIETDVLVLPKVMKMMLGEEQKKALYKSLEDENGRVPIEAITDAITEIMTKAGEEPKN
jgi:hypothetical protein